MAIRIKRSSGDSAPSSLAAGQMAYVEGSTNGGTLYYGEIGGTVREIAGKKFIDKLSGIEAGAEVNAVDSVNGQTGTVVIDTDDLASFNTDVDARITSSAITTALGFTPESSANKNEANGYAGLDSSGKVASAQLPSYVDDVVEAANFAALPGTGETGKIYVALDNGKVYRWSGSAYVEISASPGSTDSVTEGSTNLYFTNARARAAISVTQNLSYNDSTGVITGPDLSSYLTTVALNDVSDVTISSPSTGQALVYNGVATQWENTTLNFLSSVSEDASPTLGGNLSVASYSIVAPVNNDINITPSGTGNVVISGQAFPGADGDANQVLKTDGSGNLSWTTLGAGVSAIDDLSDVTISAPTTGQILTYTMSGQWENQNAPSGGIASVSADTNPALGGNLDLADYEITNTITNGHITVATNGSGNIYLDTDTGYVYLNDLKFPNADGTANQVLKTNGSGVLSWTTVESFSGDYDDLTNKPTLFSGDYDDLSNKPSLVTTFTGLSDTPALYTAFGGAIVRVNSAATGLEFTSDLDDGTF